MNDMNAWQDVGAVADFPVGSVRVLDAGDVPVAVFRTADGFYALEDCCSHEEEPLSGGLVNGDEVVCPRHGAVFSLRSGAALTPPAYSPVRTFPVRIVNGVVQVRTHGEDDSAA